MNTPADTPAWTIEELRLELDRYEAELHTEGKLRNTITSYVYPVDRFLHWLAGPYRPIGDMRRPGTDPEASRDSVSERRGRSSYDGLRAYLSEQTEEKVQLSFEEIERIIGRRLPSSARDHRAWWANERSGSHVHARSWLEAHPPRHTRNVDMDAKTVDFVIPERR